jgi:predicted aspartyl protease
MIIVAVEVNGQGPFEFFLDTGVDTTVIDPSLADKLALTRSGHALQVSLGGQRTLDRSRLSKLALGTAQVDGLPVLIEDLTSLRQVIPQIQGIVGQVFLSHFNYLLDYRKRTIRFESGTELRDRLTGSHVALEPVDRAGTEKMMVLANAQAIHQAPVRLVLDSGANDLVLMQDASRRLFVPIKQIRWEQSLGSSRAVQCGPVRIIKFGTEELHDVTAAISTEAVAQFGDGLLPTSLFHSIYFNNQDRFVIFNPRGSAAPAD